MESDRQRRVEELFHSALRFPVEQRPSFLKDACRDDAQLLLEVESLLAYESSAKNFIESPAFQIAARLAAQEGSQAEDVPSQTTPGARYYLLEKLGGGGMGVVYKANDTRLRRTVALKFLPFELASNAISLERFQREAQAASSLNHPSICTVYDAGELDGRPFIAMELLEGETLERRIANKPLPVEEVIRLAIQITEALEAAHGRGIIHRDIKPSNIFITSKGDAKILDFGVAKLQAPESSEPAEAYRDQAEPVSDLTLTRTGEAVGTAAYMSPEQVRGERLDSRTDLFSLGLVLYEMATGKRAFAGDTTAAIQKAILEQTPAPMRMLAPGIPGRLDKIVSKALRKDRETRYQSAAEMRSDLGVLQKSLRANSPVAKWMIAGATVVLAIVGVLWTARERPSLPSTLRVLKQRQLTTNSSENQVKSGAISPDAKYLSYADLTGIHIKVLKNGKTTTIPQPARLDSTPANWDIGPWLPDSSGFMASLDNPTQPPDYWLVSLSGGAPRRIRGDINPWSYSPADSWLAATMKEDLSSVGGSEIWIMEPDGTKARKVYEANDKSIFRWITWSPNGRRLAYVRDGLVSGKHELTIESRDRNGTSPVTMLSSADLRGFDSIPVGEQQLVWLRDGRLVFEKSEPGGDCPANLFEARIDNQTGTLREKPKQITDWTGFCIFGLTASANGKHITFGRQTEEMPIFVAGLDTATPRIGTLSRLTLTEDKSLPMGWTRDSKAVVFVSKRDGAWGIYKQKLDATTPEPVVTGLQESPEVDMADDSILYLHPEGPSASARDSVLTRFSSSGVSHEILRGHFNAFGCGWLPNSPCVISELTDDRKQIVFTAFDPLKGRGQELARFRDEHVDDLYWRLSPDGKQIALVRQFEGQIRLLSLERGSVQQIEVKRGAQIRLFDWAAGGRGFYASIVVQQGARLAHIDLYGNLRSLWQDNGHNVFLVPRPAPDGRHIAIGASRQTTNLWMIDNF